MESVGRLSENAGSISGRIESRRNRPARHASIDVWRKDRCNAGGGLGRIQRKLGKFSCSFFIKEQQHIFLIPLSLGEGIGNAAGLAPSFIPSVFGWPLPGCGLVAGVERYVEHHDLPIRLASFPPTLDSAPGCHLPL